MVNGFTDVLVGRDDEIAELLAVLTSTDAAIALISGEPGVGKTRLLNESLAAVDQPHLFGTSSPASMGRPFDLLLSVVEPVVRWWSEIPGDLSAVAGPLTQLLRSTATGLEADDHVSVATGDLIGAGIALVRHLGPELIVLDDLHWADVESLQVIERLVSASEHPSFVIGYRSEELTSFHPAAELVSLIERRHSPVHVHLEPFDPSQVAEYLLATLGQLRDERLIERLHARTGGSPFFLEQLLSNGEDLRADAASLPRSLEETIRLQLEDLDDGERDLLAVAAVLGGRFEFDLLAAAADLDEATIIARLRPLVARRILMEGDVDLFRFRHELVRESVLSWLLGRERRRLHERAFVALRALRPGDFAELARHAKGAGRLKDLVELAPHGARHYLSNGSAYQALRLAEAALTEMPDHPELCELAGRSAWLMGELSTARRHADRWRALTIRDHSSRQAEAIVFAMRIAYESCDDVAERELVGELRDRLAVVEEARASVGGAGDGANDAEEARITAALAQFHMLHGENETAIAFAERADELAKRAGLDDVSRRARIERSSALMFDAARRERGRIELIEIAEECEAAGDDVGAARAWHNVTVNSDDGDADETLERMRLAAVRCGFDSMSVHSFSVKKVDLAVHRGDLHEAISWASRSRLLGRGSRTRTQLALVEALLAVETGDDGESERLLAELEGRLSILHDSDVAWLGGVRAVLLARKGETDAAVAALDDIPSVGEHPVLLAWMFRDLRSAGVPLDALRRFLDASVGHGDGSYLSAQALLAAAEQPTAPETEALLISARSTPLLCSSGKGNVETYAVVIQAEVDLAFACLLAATGRVAESREVAGVAATRLERWPGARREDALCVMSGAASDPTSNPESDPSDSPLTGRELDVARLVAKGMTNGQIAEELYIARKTVSSHVSHILAKLSMQSRAEIAAWAVREGVAPA